MVHACNSRMQEGQAIGYEFEISQVGEGERVRQCKTNKQKKNNKHKTPVRLLWNVLY